MRSLWLISFLLLGAAAFTQTTPKVKPLTLPPAMYFSFCDLGYTAGDIRVNDMEVIYYCFNSTLIGKNKKGKEKWKIDTHKLSSKYIMELRAWEYYKNYDAFLSTRDGTYYVLKSRTGKVKKVGGKDGLFKD